MKKKNNESMYTHLIVLKNLLRTFLKKLTHIKDLKSKYTDFEKQKVLAKTYSTHF